MKIECKQKFYTIHHEGFNYYYSDVIRKETKEDSKFISYNDIIEVFVHSIVNFWDGKKGFDISPVDPDSIKSSDGNWRWRMTKKTEDIGKDIFKTKAEAKAHYEKKYSKKAKERDVEMKKLRFNQ